MVNKTCGSTDVGPPACNQRDSGPWAFDELKGGLRLRGLPSAQSSTAQVDPPPLADSSLSCVVGRAEPQRRQGRPARCRGRGTEKGPVRPPSCSPPHPIDLALDFSLQGGSGTSHILLWTNLRVATSLLSPLARSKEPPPLRPAPQRR